MEFDPNDIKNLIIHLNQVRFYGSLELTLIDGKVTVYRKIETVKPSERPVMEGIIKIIDNST